MKETRELHLNTNATITIYLRFNDKTLAGVLEIPRSLMVGDLAGESGRAMYIESFLRSSAQSIKDHLSEELKPRMGREEIEIDIKAALASDRDGS